MAIDPDRPLHHWYGVDAGFTCGDKEPGHASSKLSAVTCEACLKALAGRVAK